MYKVNKTFLHLSMGLEINEENDFDYIQDYLKNEIRSDFVKFSAPKKMDKESLKLIEQHFSLYNKAIKTLNENANYLTSENSLLKKALQFNSDLIEKLSEQINKNTAEIKELKNKKSWF